MERFKDFLRLVALALIAHAVYTNSVASAICAGTLYMGGFGEAITLFKRPKKQSELKVVPLHDTKRKRA